MARQTQTASDVIQPADVQRLDKWLWFARVAKTRTVASGLVTEGRVRVNRARITKPAHGVRAGDVITVSVARGVRVLRIVAGGVRRGPAREAAGLFEEILPVLTAPAALRDRDGGVHHGAGHGGPISDAGSGRPTKRDRRTLDRLRALGDEP